MKKIILVLITVLALNTVSGQYYCYPYSGAGINPGNLNKDVEYPVGGGISPGWTTLLGGNKATPAWSTRKKLPFTFNFNGKDYDSIWISSSGVITFSRTVGTAPAYNNNALPDATVPDNSLCIRGLLTAGNNSGYANVVAKSFTKLDGGSKKLYYITFSAYNELSLGITGFLWFSVVLEEGSNAIYFVDQRKSPTTPTHLTIGLQFDASTAMMVPGSPDVNMTSGSTAAEGDNSYWKFALGAKPAYNAEGWMTTMPDYLAQTKAPFICGATFRNSGNAAITSCDINYSINSGPAVTVPASSVNIAANGTATISSTTPWAPSVIGTYKVTVWLSNINGNPDGEGFNDSVSKNIIVVEDYFVRKPLHEVFTSATCFPCVAGNKNTDEVVFPQFPADQFTVIKYQMSWPDPGDPYYTSEGLTRRTLYGVNSIPNMQVDGGWNKNAGQYSADLFNEFKANPSFIKIEASHTINFKKVVVDVKITPLSNYNNANLKLFVVICEKMTSKNVMTNGETEFHHVMKKFLPNTSGTSIGSITKNTEKVFPTMTWIVPGVSRVPPSGQTNIINVNTENSLEELQDCEVIVFIQDIVTKEVYQSTNSVGTVLSIDNVQGIDQGFAVYPNPSADGLTYIRFNLDNASNVKINVYNAMGQLVETLNSADLVSGTNELQFNTQNYAKGMYTIQIDGEGFSSSEKFIVQ